MAEQPELRSLKEGDIFTGFLLAQEVAFKTSAKGSEYLELKLADASGDLKAFLWDLRAIEGDMDLVAADAFLKVKGQVSVYNGRTQLRLDKVRFAQDQEIGDFSRFFPTSRRPPEEMLAELDAAGGGHRGSLDPPAPGAAVRGGCGAARGLRPGPRGQEPCTTSTWAACWSTPCPWPAWPRRACAHYPELNRDLVLAGVLLHDLGKTAELTYQRSFGYSDAGNLIGHIAMEAEWINRAVARIPDFPEAAAPADPAHRPQPPRQAGVRLPGAAQDSGGPAGALPGRPGRQAGGHVPGHPRGRRPRQLDPLLQTLDRMFYKPRWPPIPGPDA